RKVSLFALFARKLGSAWDLIF
ncbi:hypothetical protein CARUB_v100079721mg, partial [Capsella rubella]